jgi:hypothetical protein
VGGVSGQDAEHSVVQPPGEVQQRAALPVTGGDDLAEQQVVITGWDGCGEMTAE